MKRFDKSIKETEKMIKNNNANHLHNYLDKSERIGYACGTYYTFTMIYNNTSKTSLTAYFGVLISVNRIRGKASLITSDTSTFSFPYKDTLFSVPEALTMSKRFQHSGYSDNWIVNVFYYNHKPQFS